MDVLYIKVVWILTGKARHTLCVSHTKMIGKLYFDVYIWEFSRSLPKHTSHYTTMVAWIEKEVEASIVGIDPSFIYLLQRVCFKFDFLEFWTVNSFHLVVDMELYVMYIATSSFTDWKCRATIVVEHSITNLPSIKCDIEIQSILIANFYQTFRKKYFSRNWPEHSACCTRIVDWNEEETQVIWIKCNVSSSKPDQLSTSCRNEVVCLMLLATAWLACVKKIE